MNQFANTFAVFIQLTFGQLTPLLLTAHHPEIISDPIVSVQKPTSVKIAKLPESHFQPVSEAVPVPTTPSPSQAPNAPSSTDNSSQASGCGDNTYAKYIYSHESSCSLTVRNAEGCIGIGQACPASKLLNVCPNLDYACENSFFTSYANATYGGWAGAYAFWLAHSWW